MSDLTDADLDRLAAVAARRLPLDLTPETYDDFGRAVAELQASRATPTNAEAAAFTVRAGVFVPLSVRYGSDAKRVEWLLGTLAHWRAEAEAWAANSGEEPDLPPATDEERARWTAEQRADAWGWRCALTPFAVVRLDGEVCAAPYRVRAAIRGQSPEPPAEVVEGVARAAKFTGQWVPTPSGRGAVIFAAVPGPVEDTGPSVSEGTQPIFCACSGAAQCTGMEGCRQFGPMPVGWPEVDPWSEPILQGFVTYPGTDAENVAWLRAQRWANWSVPPLPIIGASTFIGDRPHADTP